MSGSISYQYGPCHCAKCTKLVKGKLFFVKQQPRTVREHLANRGISPLLASQDNEPEPVTNDDFNMEYEMDDVVITSNVPFDSDDAVFGELVVDDAGEIVDSENLPTDVDGFLESGADDDYLRNEVVLQEEEEAVESTVNPMYLLIAVFLVFFQLRYTSESAMELLILFLNALLDYCGAPFWLPAKVSTLRNHIRSSMEGQGVIKFVVCPSCHHTTRMSQYRLDEFADPVNDLLCKYRDFPQRPPCNNRLFKLTSGNKAAPIKEYAYNSVKTTLAMMFARDGFQQAINGWRIRRGDTDVLYDVYDGRMWHEVRDVENNTFADDERSILLTLNVDWFQEFDTGRMHSVGAIYLAVNNLPRSQRFKPENVILVGVIPGPHEPKTHQINHYLRPLVDELEDLYVGISINHERIRAAILMVACDIPAARKVSGFTGIGSFRACYKCKRSFPGVPGNHLQRDFSGFLDVDSWERGSAAENRQEAKQWKAATTLQQRASQEKLNGVRFSELHRLKYLDLVRCTVVDPMHNLYSGTAKRCMGLWKTSLQPHTDQLMLNDRDFQAMADQLGRMLLPSGYDLPSGKVNSGCANLTSDQWRTWVLVSPFLLKEKLIGADFTIWMKFVNANRLLSRPAIERSKLDEAHELLRDFCHSYQQRYGTEEITPNMHLHMHLRESILDFGPVYAFWLFSFERLNGCLKSFATNSKDGFEVTIMRKYQEQYYGDQLLHSVRDALEIHPMFGRALHAVLPNIGAATASTATNDVADAYEFIQLAHPENANSVVGYEALPQSVILFGIGQYVKMDPMHYRCLYSHYERLQLPFRPVTDSVNIHLRMVMDRIQKYARSQIFGQEFRSREAARTGRGRHIQAYFSSANGGYYLRPGEVQYYFQHVQRLPTHDSTEDIEFKHTFAFVRWYQPYNPTSFDNLGLSVWRRDFDEMDNTCILPVHRIYQPVAVTSWLDNNVVIIPLLRKVNM